MPKVRYEGRYSGVKTTVHGYSVVCKRGDEVTVPEAVAKELLKDDKSWSAGSSGVKKKESKTKGGEST